MVLGRVRGVALVLFVVVATALGVSVGGGASASASARKGLSVSYRLADADSVTISGRTAAAAPRVRIERRTAGRWILVARVRSHHHRYSTAVRAAPGSVTTFRVGSGDRHRRVVVRMPAAAPSSLPTQYDACGARPRKADGSLWSCTFVDDFAGTELDRSKWLPQTVFAQGTVETHACYRDDPSNVNVRNGVLNLTLLRLDAPAPCGVDLAPTTLQSGMVSTWHRFSQQYGRFEARIKNEASTSPGLHETFWMWPDDRVPSTEKWPAAGEMDIAETYSSAPHAVIPFLHYSADSGGIQMGVNTNVCAAERGRWNTYTLEWSPTRIETFVNGHSCLVNTSGDPAFQKPYIIDLTQGIGPESNLPVDGTPIPATMQVDYVRAWQ
jgi:beta-glucanase (GH16 family)